MTDTPNSNLKDRAEYLVHRRFPFARAMSFPPSIGGGRARLPGPTVDQREALAKYRAELEALAPEELVTRYNAEKHREQEQILAKAEKDERERPFNLPQAAADFVHWSKMAHWTLDESIALSFGKAPELVNCQLISKYLNLSRFAVQYSRRRDLAMRAAQWKQLYDPVLPTIFLAWAQRNEIDVPVALVDQVAKRAPIADWKSLYDELKAKHEEKESAWRTSDEAKDRLAMSLQDHIRELESRHASQPAEKSLGAKERDSLLKIIIGMALEGYKYDPKAARSTVPQEIADDLAKQGITMDVDTVRKWLKQAAELLPGD